MTIRIPAAILAAVFSFELTTIAHATLLPGPIFDPYSGANLYVVSQGSWLQAQAEAESLGGNLITIHSSTENQFVVNNVLQDFSGSGGLNLSALPLWIGFYDPTGIAQDDGPGGTGSVHQQNFVWVDGSTSAYENWNTATSEPNDSKGAEYYTTINWHYSLGDAGEIPGTWNDTPLDGSVGYGGNSDGPYYGIAAVPVPEPSSAMLLAGGLLALFAIVRSKTLQKAIVVRRPKTAALRALVSPPGVQRRYSLLKTE